MSRYVRWYVPGATYFFTVVTERRAPLFADADNRSRLHAAFAAVRREYPFEMAAIVLLPDHLHAIWTLPNDDVDYSNRWQRIKRAFTMSYLESGGSEQSRSASRVAHRNRGVWQRRFHEHVCCDENDLGRHVEYIHFNPVKHGYARCPHDWPHSSFHRWVADGTYRRDWCCVCDSDAPPPDFSWAEGLE